MGTLTGATKSNIHIEIEKKLTFCLYIQLILPNGTGPVKIFCEGSEDVMMALGFEDSKSSLDVTSLKEICVGLHFLILGVSLVEGDVTLVEVKVLSYFGLLIFVLGIASVEIDSFGTLGLGSVVSVLLFVGICPGTSALVGIKNEVPMPSSVFEVDGMGI